MKRQQQKDHLLKSPSKLQSQNKNKNYAGERTLNREARDKACGELKKQYAKILLEFPDQINKIENLAKEIISSLKELNLQKVEEDKETLVDNTIGTLTEGFENLQNFQASLQALTKKLEKSSKNIKKELQKDTVFQGIENDLQDIKNKKEGKQILRKSKQDIFSYQELREKLQDDKLTKHDRQTNPQKTSEQTFHDWQTQIAALDANSRNTIPEGLKINFETLKRGWEQRAKTNSAKETLNKEENIGEKSSEKNVTPSMNKD